MKLSCRKKLTKSLEEKNLEVESSGHYLKQWIHQQKQEKRLRWSTYHSRNRSQTVRNIVSFLLQESVATWRHQGLDFSVPTLLVPQARKGLKKSQHCNNERVYMMRKKNKSVSLTQMSLRQPCYNHGQKTLNYKIMRQTLRQLSR